jgi:hypothetical protein
MRVEGEFAGGSSAHHRDIVAGAETKGLQQAKQGILGRVC